MLTNQTPDDAQAKPDQSPETTPVVESPAKKKRKPPGKSLARRNAPDEPRKGSKHLTPAQRAQAAALWRSGEVTLDDLSKRFGRSAPQLSRMFTQMGIQKGEAAKKHEEKIAKEMEAKLLGDASEQALRIAKVKEEHFKMADGLGKLVWAELVRARQAGASIATLRGTMHTLQMASATLGTVRKELYEILRIAEHDERKEDEDLPELTIRELLPAEVRQLQLESQSGGELGDLDVGVDELPPEPLSPDNGGESA